jgi:hypothetical protein
MDTSRGVEISLLQIHNYIAKLKIVLFHSNLSYWNR